MASRERKPSRCRIESFPEELRAESTPFQLETDLGNFGVDGFKYLPCLCLLTLSYLLREQDVISEQGGKFSQNS